MESRKMVWYIGLVALKNLFAGQEWRCKCRGQTRGQREGEEERIGRTGRVTLT